MTCSSKHASFSAASWGDRAPSRTCSRRAPRKIGSALAPLYGVTVNGTAAQTVMLPANQRSGILTQAGIVSGWAKQNRSVHRGLFVFRELLCGQVPSPPAGTNITPPAGIKTEREFAAYRAANSCKGCHSNFDPIGLSYENYDPFGRFITERDGATVISSGTITLDDQPRTYGNVVELGALLADSQQVRQCVAEKLNSYAFGRRPSVERFVRLQPGRSRNRVHRSQADRSVQGHHLEPGLPQPQRLQLKDLPPWQEHPRVEGGF